jgi:hypothetical protein
VAIQDPKSGNSYLVVPEHLGAITVKNGPSHEGRNAHLLAHLRKMFTTLELIVLVSGVLAIVFSVSGFGNRSCKSRVAPRRS